jgi:hypothetical protein
MLALGLNMYIHTEQAPAGGLHLANFAWSRSARRVVAMLGTIFFGASKPLCVSGGEVRSHSNFVARLRNKTSPKMRYLDLDSTHPSDRISLLIAEETPNLVKLRGSVHITSPPTI